MSSQVRVRFAPSPTGYLHVGGARTALFNWLFARKNGGKFILRIEDTDAARNTPAAMAAITDGLKWMGLDWDEGPEIGGPHGPYFQSQRNAIYDSFFAKLDAAGHLYTEENGAVRFRFSRQPITIPDLVCGNVELAGTTEPDMTIRRPDGSYIFHFVNVVDDIEMGITHVIRGEDHLSNTWKHIDLFHALGHTPPVYAHIPLMLNDDGTKMSKRDAGAALGSYMDEGYVGMAVFNFLCRVGWTPRAESEILSKEQLTELFDPAQIHSSNAKFDLKKCAWFNGQYLRLISQDELYTAAKPHLLAAEIAVADDAFASATVWSVREKITKLNGFPEWVHYFFREDYPMQPDAQQKLDAKPENAALIAAAAASLATVNEWTEGNIQAAVEAAAVGTGVKAGALMPLLRFKASGQSRGPGVATILSLIGKEKALARLSA